MRFLPRENIISGEAKKLLVQAFDFKPKIEFIIPKLDEKKEFEPVSEAIPEQYFPPCIQKISKGLTDGKKRALLVLINFLSSIGWNYEKIEAYVSEWNKRNQEPLREVYIRGQMNHAKQRKKPVLPPNCSNKAYMVDIGACNPDNFCRSENPPGSENFAPRIKNPANYSIFKQRNAAKNSNS